MNASPVLFFPSLPSDPIDPRNRIVRSPNCPNDIRKDDDTTPSEMRGTCGSCAWGFYTMESAFEQFGVDPKALSLQAVTLKGEHAGYRSQCGVVLLYRDTHGRIGALRTINGVERFFPGIPGNWAFERYLDANPELKVS